MKFKAAYIAVILLCVSPFSFADMVYNPTDVVVRSSIYNYSNVIESVQLPYTVNAVVLRFACYGYSNNYSLGNVPNINVSLNESNRQGSGSIYPAAETNAAGYSYMSEMLVTCNEKSDKLYVRISTGKFSSVSFRVKYYEEGGNMWTNDLGYVCSSNIVESTNYSLAVLRDLRVIMGWLLGAVIGAICVLVWPTRGH